MYREKILADLINALPAGISKNNLVVLHLKEILATLPSEKEITKGVIEEFLMQHENRFHPVIAVMKDDYDNWIEKEEE